MTDQFLYAKLPAKFKRAVNNAHRENGTYDEIVDCVERELDLNGGENDEEIHIASAAPTNQPPPQNDKPKISCTYCGGRIHTTEQCRFRKRDIEKKHEAE